MPTPHLYIVTTIEYFDWTSPDGKTSITFRVTDMLNAISTGTLRAQRVTTRIDTEFVELWLVKRELSDRLIARMTPERRNEPVLGAWMPDGSVLLIDGSHRYMARYLEGLDEIDYNLIAYDDWQGYATIMGEPL